jgi:hypothetical protein
MVILIVVVMSLWWAALVFMCCGLAVSGLDAFFAAFPAGRNTSGVDVYYLYSI